MVLQSLPRYPQQQTRGVGEGEGDTVGNTDGVGEPDGLANAAQADGMGTNWLAYDPVDPGHAHTVDAVPSAPLPSLI
jgi:hypothetical protein